MIPVGVVATGVYLLRYKTTLERTSWLVFAGLLVDFGIRMGNGCTSGHGVCGIARLSRRSIVATLVFIATGALTVLGGRSCSYRPSLQA